jgi:SAM-dependent methyltransferase
MLRLYDDLAAWWPLISAPEEYAEEAEFYWGILVTNSASPPRTMLELGSGGGNNASHLKKHTRLTLVDLSPGMLEVSRLLNPELPHQLGDLRTVRLGQEFEAVFIHDAICYMLSLEELNQAITTAYTHCRPGGVALFAPDFIRETFFPQDEHGGNDGPGRAARYLQWTWDPDPDDTTYLMDFAYLLREADGSMRCEYDRHTCGLFSREEWLQAIAGTGFLPGSAGFDPDGTAPGSCGVFIGLKPAR